MAPNCKCGDATAKRIKSVMTLEEKIDMFDKLECSESVASVRHFHINGSCVRTIKRAANKASVTEILTLKAMIHVQRKPRNHFLYGSRMWHKENVAIYVQ
jgi:hypothetical protein